MLLLVAVMLAAITVPIFGGRLLALADLRFNRAWLILAAIGVQIAIVSVLPSGTPAVHVVAHICSYVLAGWFLAANTQIAGLWIIVLGGALNFIAIVANGGVMPADPDAFATAGLITQPGEFANSTSLPDPQLTFLGDIFAVPKSWPLHNVYSIGDVLIAVGACVLIHRACGSRLIPATRGDLSSLRQHRGFMRLWVAQGISNIGDWVYALAVVTSLVERHVGGNTLGLLIVLQVGPAALAGFIGGPFIDRFPRKALMIGADVLRAAAVGSLLLAGTPSLAHLYVVAACVGIGSAVFQPSLQASLPNLVPQSKLVAANAALGATYHLAVMIGPVLGGLLAAGLGPSPAFLINGASFAVSAVLIATAVVPRRAASAEPHAAALTALMDGARFIRSSVLARGVLIVTGMVIFAATLRTPLEPLFVLRTLHAGPQALGLTGGIWGVGMVFGSIAAASIARRASRARVLSSSIAVVGVCILIASQAHSLNTVLCLWLIGGIGNALGTVSYESLLQEHTPDAFRGRVLAASEAVLHSAFLFGALLAGTVSGVIGVRGVYAASGVLFLAAAGTCYALLVQRPFPGRLLEPRAIGFSLRYFERVEAPGHSVLLRIGGQWREAEPDFAPEVRLLVDGGRGAHSIPALPEGRLANPDAGVWRAAFIVPVDLLDSGPAFALASDRAIIDLPRPSALQAFDEAVAEHDPAHEITVRRRAELAPYTVS